MLIMLEILCMSLSNIATSEHFTMGLMTCALIGEQIQRGQTVVMTPFSRVYIEYPHGTSYNYSQENWV